MNIIGKIRYIINSKYFSAELIKDQHPLKQGDMVEVVGEVEISDDTKKIIYPKGKLVVLNKQPDDNLYLLGSKTKTIHSPINISLSSLSSLFTEEEVPVDDSPIIDQEQSLNIKIDRKVHIGDSIIKSME